jgi:hypothetical protein
VSAPVKKSITSAGLVSSSTIGGDAVKNSIVVSKFFAIVSFLLFPSRAPIVAPFLCLEETVRGFGHASFAGLDLPRSLGRSGS